ncbi:hypothetical protein KP509_34G031400 [Ceratopteris richardii]|uniref:Uncharacterized protein n=1 Tax=Ceratopteris richardii TaxID=49495 RepID=A0A8T2QIJ3_CERRI|nr:hypothetical protein KP509_34G031400 [Ceratopteris richardii]
MEPDKLGWQLRGFVWSSSDSRHDGYRDADGGGSDGCLGSRLSHAQLGEFSSCWLQLLEQKALIVIHWITFSSPYQKYQIFTLGLSQYVAAARFDEAMWATAMFPEQG